MSIALRKIISAIHGISIVESVDDYFQLMYHDSEEQSGKIKNLADFNQDGNNNFADSLSWKLIKQIKN